MPTEVKLSLLQNPNKCLNVSVDSTTIHLCEELKPNDPNYLNQIWLYDQTLQTLTSARNGKCLQLEGSTNNGAQIYLWENLHAKDPNNENQRWQIMPSLSGIARIRSVKNPRMCLQIAGPAENGEKVHLWEEADDFHSNVCKQEWLLKPSFR